ncbi:MAG: NAD(P)-dependent oxidoreductase [Phycisphaerales bacterium]|jgi:3-hydroxyisobutyrate dehydrogenase|nr:NAD(P)-dependent oxidoreductase [Phycisphaerales bacterium]
MRIAFLGTGVMGASMAGHLIDAGHDLTIHTRTQARAEALLSRGAIWAETPAVCADAQDVVISIVGLPSDVESVYLGPEGVLAAGKPPSLLIDMTTSTPSLARRIHQEASLRGISSIDAPVSGGDVGARNGTLSIMVGGDHDAITTAMPLLEAMGGSIVHQGGPGAGQHTKMVNQILIASMMVGASEGLLYAERAGLDGAKVIESVGGGAAGSWTINTLGPRMLQRDFEPGFYVEHFLKDLSIALQEAQEMGLELPGLIQAHALYARLEADGLGRKGTQVLLTLLERLNEVQSSS